MPLGILDGAPLWISAPQFQAWEHAQVIIDAVPERGGGFSVEAPRACGF